jgi:transcription elongation factor B subunit 1
VPSQKTRWKGAGVGITFGRLRHFFRAIILEVVCRYLYYKWRYEGSATEIPEFKIDPEVVLETLMTADFLEC